MGCSAVTGRAWPGAWALLALLVCVWPRWASAQSLELSVFETVGAEVPAGEVLAGKYAAQFRPRPEGHVVLPGSPSHVFWLRLQIAAPGNEEWVLLLDRIDLDRIALFVPRGDGTWLRPADGFFEPLPGSLSPDAYAFALPGLSMAPKTFYLQVRGAVRMNLAPRLLDEVTFRARDRAIAIATAASYAALLVLMLSALAMYLALREPAYSWFVALTGGMLLILAAINGHLYRLPGPALFGWWGSDGLHALVLLGCVLALGFSRRFLDLPRVDARADRRLKHAHYLLGGVALFCLFNVDALSARMQWATAALAFATVAMIVLLALQAWRRGQAVARAYALIWTLLGIAVGMRAAVALGGMPPAAIVFYGFQVAVVLGMFLVSIGLVERVWEFRKQRDHAHQLKRQTDASLQVEQVRREFAEGLRDQLRNTSPGGDMEWRAFHRLLTALRRLLPQQDSAVVAFGYHGLDLLMCEPMGSKDRYSRLLAARGGTLKTLCRSRNAVQARLDEQTEPDAPMLNPDGGLFAVVPMAMPVPGWGALLIERAPWEAFEAHELKLAADFLKQAVAATDEAIGQAELKKKAELDPLTGAGNRRNGDAMLERALRRAIADRKPLSVLFVDLDHFKQVNDKHGHAVGDDCLRVCADAVRRELAPDDALVRHGGEEFLVILPDQNADRARQLGERIRQAVAQLRLQGAQGVAVKFTVSIGVAARLPNEEDAAGMVQRADKALYAAKRNGRNQVQVAPLYGYGQRQEEEPPPPLAL